MTVEKPTPYSADAGSNPAWFIPDLVAQLVEQYTFNVWVAGSNPAGITKQYGPVAQLVRATDS
jgi:hypothetical protein